MTRVCHLSTLHPLHDTRILYKECFTLRDAGYEVNLVIGNQKDQIIDGIKVWSIPVPKQRLFRFLIGNFNSIRKALTIKPGILHFHDPELIPAGLILRFFGIKIIYDVHELVYDHLMDKPWLGNMLLKKWARTAYKYFEKLAVKRFSGIVLAYGYTKYFETNYKKYSEKIISVRNLSYLEGIKNAEKASLDNKFRYVVYAGSISKIRGIVEIISAMQYVEDDVRLLLIGAFESEALRNECIQLHGWKKVIETGFVKPKEVYSYIKASDICLSLLYPVKNYKESVPVKILEYMAMKKPVIISNFATWEKLYGDMVLYSDPTNKKEIARQINRLLRDSVLSQQMAEKSYNYLMENRLYWEEEKKKLIDLYLKILKP